MYRADDMNHLVHRSTEVIVHHNVVIGVCHLHLFYALRHALFNLFRRFGLPINQPASKFLSTRRQNENGYCCRVSRFYLRSALVFNIQNDDIVSLVAQLLYISARRTMQIALIVRILRKSILTYAFFKLRPFDEEVIDTMLFIAAVILRSRNTSRTGDGYSYAIKALADLFNDRVFTTAGRGAKITTRDEALFITTSPFFFVFCIM